MQRENLNLAREATGSQAVRLFRTAAVAFLVCVGYYVGANIGFILRFPPATPSIMWPPNAILTATLLLVPPRWWWLYLLAAFPAHLAAELGLAWSPSLVLALFITNCSEALLAAGGVRWLSDAPVRFDTLRRVAVFIVVAVLLAPFVSSFADAAAVATLQGEPYWFVWRTRLFSKVLTELTLVPALVMLITAGPAWLWGASSSQRAEAALLAGALGAVGVTIFAGPLAGLDAIPDLSRTLLVLLLPFFLWAAVRFGPGGTSLALLATAFLALWAASHGRGPFAGLPPAESVLSLQLSLTVVAIPLMCLAALIEERQRSERMKSAILASLPSSVAVLDREGRIVAVNAGWTQCAHENGAPSDGVGVNYSEVWPQVVRPDTAYAAKVLAGIAAVLDGARPTFALEYASRTATGERWFVMSVIPLGRSEGGVVISHTDITERKQAEMEVQQSRQELVHFTRVSTIGALTASLAHELNQPLTGILANAQAARRFLHAMPPTLGEIQDILSDIVGDVKRAGEVIHSLRDLLRKDACPHVLLNLNALSRDVVKLVSSDAVIRNVTVTLDFDPQPALVHGDRIQLQQVVLNLLLNAMEAMAEGIGGDRTVTVRTRNIEAQTVQVSVQDTGPGLRDGTQDLVFKPFYTTKPAGIGMGLSITRSIIEAHGGVIWAANNPPRGVAFHFTLPRASGESV